MIIVIRISFLFLNVLGWTSSFYCFKIHSCFIYNLQKPVRSTSLYSLQKAHLIISVIQLVFLKSI